MNTKVLIASLVFVGAALSAIATNTNAGPTCTPTTSCVDPGPLNCVPKEVTHYYALTGGAFATFKDGAVGVANTATQDLCTNPAYHAPDPNCPGDGNPDASGALWNPPCSFATPAGDGDPEFGNNGAALPSNQECLDFNSLNGADHGASATSTYWVSTVTQAHHATANNTVFYVHDAVAPTAGLTDVVATEGTDGPATNFYSNTGTTAVDDANNCSGNGVVSNDPTTDPLDCGSGLSVPSTPANAAYAPVVTNTAAANCGAAADGFTWVFLAAGPVYNAYQFPNAVDGPTHGCTLLALDPTFAVDGSGNSLATSDFDPAPNLAPVLSPGPNVATCLGLGLLGVVEGNVDCDLSGVAGQHGYTPGTVGTCTDPSNNEPHGDDVKLLLDFVGAQPGTFSVPTLGTVDSTP